MVYSMPSWIMALPDRFGRLESAEDPAPPRPSLHPTLIAIRGTRQNSLILDRGPSIRRPIPEGDSAVWFAAWRAVWDGAGAVAAHRSDLMASDSGEAEGRITAQVGRARIIGKNSDLPTS